jgi:tetratricopeptide (TPR) repeat protein
MREGYLKPQIAVALLALAVSTIACGGKPGTDIPADKFREYANELYNKGLYSQAVSEYERYLDLYDINSQERANIIYLIGDIYFERIKDYEAALAAYLKVKVLYPENPLQEEVNKKIVASLERLERSADAQQVLEESTVLNPSTTRKRRPGAVVAKIGSREITLGDLEFEINQLPPYLRPPENDRKAKIEFLNRYIATELFYSTALRKGLDKDKEVIEGAFQAKKQLMVQKLLQEEIAQKVNITEADIELYYKANRDRYAKRDTSGNVISVPPLAEVRQRVTQDLIRERQQKEYEALLQRMMRAQAVEIYEDRVR